MSNRREFLKGVASASAGAFVAHCNCGLMWARPLAAQNRTTVKHRPVMVGGRKIKTVDMHCHIVVPEAAGLLQGTPLEGAASMTIPVPPLGAERLEKMDEMGIDVEAVSIVPFWYAADRDLATRLIDLQNQKLAGMCAAHPDRFVGFGTVALQFPDLAVRQLEAGIKLGLKGAAIGGSVQGEELSSPKYDPFWAKAEELQAPVFMHPTVSAESTGITKRLHGNGILSTVIGNPLETTLFLSHLIYDGVLDRFANLKLCCAHGGGYLPSYADRMDNGCLTFPERCKGITIKKKPTEYLKQIYVDSLVFTPEALRHLVAVMGPRHIVLGTDYPTTWNATPVDHVFATPGLNDADRVAILGGTACQLLGISS
jgi:predicted TIM-barrel fold metal-dependent hydrolase